MPRELPTLGGASPRAPLPTAAVVETTAQPTAAAHDEATAETALTRVDLAITGMTCAACARRVSTGVLQGGGVRDVLVNAATGRATIWYDAATVAPAALEARVERAGYGVVRRADGDLQAQVRAERAARQEEVQAARRRALVALLLAAPVALLAMAHGRIAAFDAPWAWWVQAVLSTLVLVWPGAALLRDAVAALRHRTPDISVLVALGTGAAWLASAVALWRSLRPAAAHAHTMMPALYFEAAAVTMAFVLLGRWIEAGARSAAADALDGVARTQPRVAQVRDGAGWRDVPLAEVARDAVVLVRPGERIPVDGVVVDGRSSVDESLVTGESVAVPKAPGDAVSAGALNGVGVLQVRTTAVGDESTIARIVTLVRAAQGARAPSARLADAVSARFVPAVLLLALATVVVWMLVSPAGTRLATALPYGIAVLVVACPCALGLATPLALLVGTTRAARLGILYRSGAALEATAQVQHVLLDKTGTLTVGAPTLLDVRLLGTADEATVLVAAASLESVSEHPLGAAIVKAAGARGLVTPAPRDVRIVPGRGIEGVVAGRPVQVGSAEWLAGSVLAAPVSAISAAGATPVVVTLDGAPAALLAIADAARPDAVGALRDLATDGIGVELLSGDAPETVAVVARAVGATAARGGATPADKVAAVEAHERAGRRVAMVGDGLNDAAALARATAGIAMGTGSDLTVGTADVVVLRPSVSGAVDALRLARATRRVIRQNLWWALGYNVLALPTAAGVLAAPLGWRLTPMLASALMVLSSLGVVLNSLRLRGLRLG